MQPDLLASPLSEELLPQLRGRYCPGLPADGVTPQSVAHAVWLAVRRVYGDARRTGGVGAVGVPVADVWAALTLVPRARQQLDSIETALIEVILDHGVTWEELGAGYGNRSPQAMQQLYRRRGGARTWTPGPIPQLGSSTNTADSAANEVWRAIPEVAGTWQVRLRRGCRPSQQVLDEVLPAVMRLEKDNQTIARRPWPEWLAKNRAFPRRVRSAVQSIEQVNVTGSTVVVSAALDITQ